MDHHLLRHQSAILEENDSSSSPERHQSPYGAPLATGLDETEGRRLLLALDKLKQKLQRDNKSTFEKSYDQIRQDQATSFSDLFSRYEPEVGRNSLRVDKITSPSSGHSHLKIGSEQKEDRLALIERQLETIVHLINQDHHRDSGRDSVSGSPSETNSSSSSPSNASIAPPVRLEPKVSPQVPAQKDESLQTDLPAPNLPQATDKIISTETGINTNEPQKHRKRCPKHGNHACQVEANRQAAASKAISCRHYHFNIKEVPFVPVTAGQSHSSIANAQKLLAEMRSSPGRLSSKTPSTRMSHRENCSSTKTPSTSFKVYSKNNRPLVSKKGAKSRANDSELEMKMLHAELDDLLFELHEEQHFIAEEIDALMDRLTRAPSARLRNKLQSEVELLESRLSTKQKQIIDLKRVCDDFITKYSLTLDDAASNSKSHVEGMEEPASPTESGEARVSAKFNYAPRTAPSQFVLRPPANRTVRFQEPEESVPKWF